MNPALVAFAAFSMVFWLLIVAGFLYYIRISLKKRVAIAPGWSFDRDEQPVRFWVQISVAGFAALKIMAEIVLAAIKLFEMGLTF